VKTLAIGAPDPFSVTADERQVLTLLAAAQTEDHTLFQAHLRWLAGRSGVTNSGHARPSDIRPSERPSLFRRISAANAAQCASIEAKMPKCRRKNRQGDI
jgi:hypothetical protein